MCATISGYALLTDAGECAIWLLMVMRRRAKRTASTSRLSAQAAKLHKDDVGCDDPEAVKLMVDFFYFLDYTTDDDKASERIVVLSETGTDLSQWGKQSKRGSSAMTTKRTVPEVPKPKHGDMIMHAKVFTIATKYQSPALATLAAKKFKIAVDVDWKRTSFAVEAHLAYTTTEDSVKELRIIIADAVHAHEQLLEVPEVEVVVCAQNGLAYQLLRRARGSDVPSLAVRCESCGHEHCNDSFCVSESGKEF